MADEPIDGGLDVGFALPDPDEVTGAIEAVQSIISTQQGSVRGALSQKIAHAQGVLAEQQQYVDQHVRDQIGAVADVLFSQQAPIQQIADSTVAIARGVASVNGYEIGTIPTGPLSDQLAGVPLYPPGSGPGILPVPTQIAQYYCLRSGAGIPGCISATPTQLKLFVAQGVQIVSGPYRTAADCVAACLTLPRVLGDLGVPGSTTNGGPIGSTSDSTCIVQDDGTVICPPPGPGPIPEPPPPIPPPPVPIPSPVPIPIPPPPPPPPPTCIWWCVAEGESTNRHCEMTCSEEEKLQIIARGDRLLSAHSTLAECLAVCEEAPPPPPPPPPPEPNRWWCLKAQYDPIAHCQLSPYNKAELEARGFVVQSGPYDSEAGCRLNCGIPIVPAKQFWCMRRTADDAEYCLYADTLYDAAGRAIPPVRSGQLVVGGPWRSSAECAANCALSPPPPPPPPPVPIPWWCIQGPGGIRFCVHAAGPNGGAPATGVGEQIVGGPHGTQEECEAACITPPPPPPPPQWYCICKQDTDEMRCWESGIEVPPGWDICAGPYDDEAECTARCKKPPPPQPTRAWWCVQGYNSRYCLQGRQDVRPPGAIAGPFGSKAECEAFCIEPVPPTPPPPPPPPVPPYQPPGIICPAPPPCPVEKCCPPDEDEKKKNKEAHTWRTWQGCDGVCYVTGPGEGPRSSADSLIGTAETIEAAIAQCPAVKCDDKSTTPPPTSAPTLDNPWNSDTVCDDIERRIRGSQSTVECSIAANLGWVDKDGKPIVEPQPSVIPSIAPIIHTALNAVLGSVFCRIEKVLRTIASNDRCSGFRQLELDGQTGLLNWVSRLIGADVSRYTNPIKYEQQYLCPSILPSLGEATASWLRGEISDDLWNCWAKANGHLIGPAIHVRQASRTRHTSQDLIRLWLRDIIKDSDLDKRVRELGYTEQRDYDELRELGKQYPPYSDIIRMMVRDAADETIPDWPDSDDIFKQKYTGLLADWGKFGGLPEDVAKLAWRAHWSIPSPGQLYEVWHRLRRRGDTIADTDLGKEISGALLQQDILPRWIPRLIEISNRVLTRVDIRRAYQIGVLPREQVDSAYIKLGYDDNGARVLTDFTVQQARLALRGHKAVGAYQSGGYGRQQATDDLREYGAAEADIQWVLDWAIKQVRVRVRTTCTKSIKRRYLTGELTRNESIAALIAQGIDGDQAELFAQGWDCEQSSKGKVAQAGTLCKWLDAGLITGGEMLDRLMRIGWGAADAAATVAECERRIRIRLDREELKRRREEIAAGKAAEAERNKIARELEKQAKAAGAALERARVKGEQRDKIMLKASDKLSGKCGLPVTSTAILVRDAVRQVRAEYGTSLDAAIRAAALAADDLSTPDCSAYISLALAYAAAEREIELTPTGGAE